MHVLNHPFFVKLRERHGEIMARLRRGCEAGRDRAWSTATPRLETFQSLKHLSREFSFTIGGE